MTGSKLQAQQAREDFEHSQASKRRKWVEFINAGSIFLALGIAIAWVMS